MTQTRTHTEHTTEINTIMCTALTYQTGLLRLAFELCHPERERACYVREIPPGAGLSVLITCLLTVECSSWNTLTSSDIHPGCISIWKKTSSPFSFRQVTGCFNQGPCRACFLWFLKWGCLCSRSFPRLLRRPDFSLVRWQARSALRPCPLSGAPPWAWAWSQWGYKRRTAPGKFH